METKTFPRHGGVRLLLLGATKSDQKDPERTELSLAAPVIQDALRKQV